MKLCKMAVNIAQASAICNFLPLQVTNPLLNNNFINTSYRLFVTKFNIYTLLLKKNSGRLAPAVSKLARFSSEHFFLDEIEQLVASKCQRFCSKQKARALANKMSILFTTQSKKARVLASFKTIQPGLINSTLHFY